MTRHFDPTADAIDLRALARDRSFATITYWSPAHGRTFTSLLLPLWEEQRPGVPDGMWRALWWRNPLASTEAFLPALVPYRDVRAASQKLTIIPPVDLSEPIRRDRRALAEGLCLAVRFAVPVILNYRKADAKAPEERYCTPYGIREGHVQVNDHAKGNAIRTFHLDGVTGIRAADGVAVPRWDGEQYQITPRNINQDEKTL